MGMEFRDSNYLLSAKNTRMLKSNMVFNLALGFQDLEDTDGKKFSFLYIQCHITDLFLLGIRFTLLIR